MFWNAWKPNQQAIPAPASRPNMSSARAAIRIARQSSDEEQHDDGGRADQAELLAGDREDEVGVLLGHEARLGLRAVEEALPEQSAVADRDPRLRGVVAGAARVVGRIEERGEPVQLVALEHPELDGADRGAARPPRPARRASACAIRRRRSRRTRWR